MYLRFLFFTIIFALSFIVYDKLLWKLNSLDKIPNLSGTWVGIATNLYFEPLRLELMQIDQTWTRVSISLEIYEENRLDRGDCLGTEHSKNARITECERKYFDFDFQYWHDAKSKKDSFGGSIFLKYI
jgi:hypothetical protein